MSKVTMSDNEESVGDQSVSIPKADLSSINHQLKAQRREANKLREELSQSNARSAESSRAVRRVATGLAAKFGLEELTHDLESDGPANETTVGVANLQEEQKADDGVITSEVLKSAGHKGSRPSRQTKGERQDEQMRRTCKADANVVPISTKKRRASLAKEPESKSTPQLPLKTGRQLKQVGDKTGFLAEWNLEEGSDRISISNVEIKREIATHIGVQPTLRNLRSLWKADDHDTLTNLCKNIVSLILIENLDDLATDESLGAIYLTCDVFPTPGERSEAEYVNSMPEPLRSALLCVSDVVLKGVVTDEGDRLTLLQKVVLTAMVYLNGMRLGHPVYTKLD